LITQKQLDKKYCLLLILSFMFIKCDDVSLSTVTITNNCTEVVSVVISSKSDDSDGGSTSNYESFLVFPGDTYEAELLLEGDTQISIKAEMSTKKADYSYYGTEKDIIMIDDDFI